MKYSIEQLLLATIPSDSRNQEFIDRTLKAVNSDISRKLTKYNVRNRFTVRWIVSAVLAIFAAVIIGFSGYAYASGSNPIELIKRIVVGDSVQIEYDGRHFIHSKSLKYSDAAISAFAELNFIQSLAFKASNSYTVPQDGYEYVSNPYDTSYSYPWIGTVDSVSGATVTIHRTYTTGDKGSLAHDNDDRIELQVADATAYSEGRSKPFKSIIGRTVVVHQYAYMKHKVGSDLPPQAVTHFFIFASKHSLQDITQANQATGRKDDKPEVDYGLFETDWGDVNIICLNNGADRCLVNTIKPKLGGSLYMGTTGITTNPNVVAFGEGLSDNISDDGQLMRGIEGKIIEINASGFTLQSSSGQLWQLDYDIAHQNAFAAHSAILKVGDTISGTIVGSVNELNDRVIDSNHIYELRRI